MAEDDFLLLASDGLFECTTPNDLALLLNEVVLNWGSKARTLKEIKSESEMKKADCLFPTFGETVSTDKVVARSEFIRPDRVQGTAGGN